VKRTLFLRLGSLAVLAATIVLFQNCNKVSFSNMPAAGDVAVNGQGDISGGGHCNLFTLTVPVKILFVVDTSGSNNHQSTDEGTAYCNPSASQVCAPATDPNKTFRSGSISAFFNVYQTKNNFSWGLEAFSNDQISNYTTGFENAQGMASSITFFNSETDNGDTPYILALNAARNYIANDPDLNSTAVHPPLYNIIFMSDGYPTDALNNDGSVDMTEVDQAIAQIVALSPTRISLNAAYYGTIDDPVAANTLQSMATAGAGQFVNVDTSSTSSISISDLITIPEGQCL
jgi:hypothetical protein